MTAHKDTTVSVATACIDSLTFQNLLIQREQKLRALIRSRLAPDLRIDFSEDDVLQEIWLIVFRNRASYCPDGPSAFDRWLTSIAIRGMINLVKCANRLKRGGGQRILREQWNPGSSCLAFLNDIAGEGRTPSREAFAMEAAEFVKDALSSLSPVRQRVVSMRYFEGRSLDEIAKETGRTKPAVRTLVIRSMRQLKDQLGHSSHFFSDAATTEA